MPFPWKLGWFPRAIPAPRYVQVQYWVLLVSCMEEECVFLWVMRMHCFVQNRELGVLEHSGKCVINEEVVTHPAYCSLFCWSQGKLSEPEGSVWCSKHDLLPCDGSREQICLPAALCLLQSGLSCTCVVPDPWRLHPVNPDPHVLRRTNSAFSSLFSRGRKKTLITDIMVGGKYPCEIPYSKPHMVNKRKSHSVFP